MITFRAKGKKKSSIKNVVDRRTNRYISFLKQNDWTLVKHEDHLDYTFGWV